MWKMIVKKVATGETFEEEISVIKTEGRGRRARKEVKVLRKNASLETAEKAAQDVINYFNSTLREWESPREVIGVFKVEKQQCDECGELIENGYKACDCGEYSQNY